MLLIKMQNKFSCTPDKDICYYPGSEILILPMLLFIGCSSCTECGIEKSVPRDHRLASLGKPRDHCLRRRDAKELICLLRHITTEKSGLYHYALCITRNTIFKSNTH